MNIIKIDSGSDCKSSFGEFLTYENQEANLKSKSPERVQLTKHNQKSVSGISVMTVIHNPPSVENKSRQSKIDKTFDNKKSNPSIKKMKSSNSMYFTKLMRDQTIDLINKKLEDYYGLTSNKRTFPQFKPLFKCLCQNYFIEVSQEEDEVKDPQLFIKMIAKFKILVEQEFENKSQDNMFKPDTVDMLIELLKDENTFNIEQLTLVVLETLLKISESVYLKDKEDLSSRKNSNRLLLMKGSLKVGEGDKCKPLTSASLGSK